MFTVHQILPVGTIDAYPLLKPFVISYHVEETQGTWF